MLVLGQISLPILHLNSSIQLDKEDDHLRIKAFIWKFKEE